MKLNGFDTEKHNIIIHTAIPLAMKIPNTIKERHTSALLYVVRGGIRFNVNGKEMIARERDIIYLPEGCSYSYKASKEISAMQVEFDLKDRKTGKNLTFSLLPVLACSDTPENLSEHFSTIIKSFWVNDTSSKIGRTCRFLELLQFIEDSLSDQNPQEIKLAPALYRLREGYCEKIYTKELARLCNLSESQLRRLFKETYGVSPITYKNNLRIKMACSLLESGSYSISEISEILGFEDIYAFSHAFKKTMNISPAEYKK